MRWHMKLGQYLKHASAKSIVKILNIFVYMYIYKDTRNNGYKHNIRAWSDLNNGLTSIEVGFLSDFVSSRI